MTGVFFSYAALRTRSLLGVSMAHGLINITMFLIYPFLV
jgi:membrane protease YdiL (CAAX protease family)